MLVRRLAESGHCWQRWKLDRRGWRGDGRASSLSRDGGGMRPMLLVPALLCGACGGAAMTATDSGGVGTTVWWTTCGPPACAGDAAIPDSGLPYCPLQQAGSACATPGAECDPYARCTGPLLCSTTDPKGMPPECPISRAKSGTP